MDLILGLGTNKLKRKLFFFLVLYIGGFKIIIIKKRVGMLFPLQMQSTESLPAHHHMCQTGMNKLGSTVSF